MVNKSVIDVFPPSNEFLSPIQAQILKSLSSGAMPRREIVRIVKKPRTTVYNNLYALWKEKLVVKIKKYNGKRGRPLTYWEIKE